MSLVEKFIATLPDDAIVVSGGASGVDSWAEVYAKQRGLQTEIYPAMWSTYGKSAGFRRNADIVNAADQVVAFWDGESKGTAHTIKLARERGKSVTIFYKNGEVA